MIQSDPWLAVGSLACLLEPPHSWRWGMFIDRVSESKLAHVCLRRNVSYWNIVFKLYKRSNALALAWFLSRCRLFLPHLGCPNLLHEHLSA